MGARGLAVGCCVALVAALTASTASADYVALEKITLFAHGDTSIGEAQFGQALRGSYMSMDRETPMSEVPKSIGMTNAGVGPNHRCAGSPFFPVWVGDLGGHITGDMLFRFHVVSSPGGQAKVRVWPDMSVMGCNDDYRTPAAMAVVDLPIGAGEVAAVMPDVNFETATNLMVQVTPMMPGPTQARVLYDATATPTSLTLSCTPLWADSCAPYE